MSVAHGAPRLRQSVSNLVQKLPATSYFNCYHIFGIVMHYNTSFGIFLPQGCFKLTMKSLLV